SSLFAMSSANSDYSHTQPGLRLVGFLLASGLGAIVFAGCLYAHWGIGFRMVVGPMVVAILLWLCSFLFSSLTVRVGDGKIHLKFGPGLIQKSFALSEVTSAKPVRNPWIAGWGIHYIGRGWLYNVDGLEAV